MIEIIILDNERYWQSSDASNAFEYDAYVHLSTHLELLDEVKALSSDMDPIVRDKSISSLEQIVYGIYAAIKLHAAVTASVYHEL